MSDVCVTATSSNCQDREYLTRKDVMSILGISYSHCDRLFKMADFPKTNVGGKALVTKADLYAYLDKYKYNEIPIRGTRT